MCKDSFEFRKEWRDAVSGMSAEMRLEFYEAVIEYATTGKEPNLKPMARLAFNFAKATLDKDAESYERICERNRKNGKNGGRPRNPVGFLETQDNPNNPVGFLETQKSGGFLERETEQEKESPMVSSPTPLSSLPLEKEKEKDRANRASAYDVNEIYLDKFFETKQELIEKLLMDFGMKPDEKKKLREIAESIVNEWRITEEFHASEEVWRKHLVNTLRIKVKLGTSSAPTKHAELNDLARQVREEREQKTQELIRKHDEWASKSVSLEEARNSEEYKRAMAEA